MRAETLKKIKSEMKKIMIGAASTDEVECARVDSNAYPKSQALREMRIKEDHDRKMKLREDYEKKCYERKSCEMCMDWVDTKVYEMRLSSFKQWPKRCPSSYSRFEKGGIRYTGYGDCYVCCWCYLVVENWNEFDEPLRIHKRRNPDCEFIKMFLPSKKIETGNYKEYENHLKTFHERIQFQVDDQVRIPRPKGWFGQGFLQNWSDEVFVVVQCVGKVPPVYKLKDVAGETLDGTFNSWEFQWVIKPLDTYFKIEKIIAQKTEGRKKFYLVKYKGYPEKFNAWAPAEVLSSAEALRHQNKKLFII